MSDWVAVTEAKNSLKLNRKKYLFVMKKKMPKAGIGKQFKSLKEMEPLSYCLQSYIQTVAKVNPLFV